jgi:hypothetical protein
MIPSFQGYVSVKELKNIFSTSEEWINLYQFPPESQPDDGPFMWISIELTPEEPVETSLVAGKNNLIDIIRVRRKSSSLIKHI